jgi:integrase
LGFRIKTGHGRLVPLEATLAEKLAGERVKSAEYVKAAAHTKVAQMTRRFVFGTKNGRPNTKMLRTLKREAHRLGLNCSACESCRRTDGAECKEWFLHKFRATFATTCLQNGIDLRTLMTLMGHNELASTMRYLAVARQDALQTKFDSVFGASAHVVMMPKKRTRRAS